MTCIVGMLDGKTNKVIIGGDSAGTSGSNITIRKDNKVFQNGEFIIGCTTSFRMIQLLRFSFKTPEIGDKDMYEYMCTDFINGVRECFKNNGFIQKFSDGDEKGGTFLVAHKNRLFRIGSDFQVGESLRGFDSCGSGQDFALGTIFGLIPIELSTEQKLTKALEAAEYLSTDVRSPFVLIST